jgi:gliding motility-associated protein GldM
MASIRETPRQKMIGILYLVLLGLVALSVNTSVLDAFKHLNDSLTASGKNLQANLSNTISSFEAGKLKDEPERARPAYDKARMATKYADELDKYLLEVKALMDKEGGGYTSAGDIRKRENVDISYRLMIRQGRAEQLKKMIADTRNKMVALIAPQDRTDLALPLRADDPPARGMIKKSWEQVNFGDGIPLTAALTSISKIRSDLKNTELEIVKKILGTVDKAVVNLDRFYAVAVAPSSYVVQGQPYTAEVFLTASDSKSNPEITVNGQPLQVNEGKGIYSVNTAQEGLHSWTGIIKVKQTDGTIKEYQTGVQQYQVARPSAVVSADKMNVFYIGVPNPISVSAPGIPKEKLRVSVSGGSISGGNGHYSVSVSKAGKVNVSVSAETAPGKVQTLSTTEYRVKNIPAPRVKFGGKTGGSMATVALKSQNKLFPVLEGFDFDAKFSINRFTMVIVKPRADAMVFQGSGNTLSGPMQSALNGIVPGTRVIFDNIIGVGPDGVKRQLDPVTLTAN